MKPLLVSQSDGAGGAARAALRLQQALVKHGVESRMRVAHKVAGDWRVEGGSSFGEQVTEVLRPMLSARLTALQHSANSLPHSLNVLPSSYSKEFAMSGADVINLHWVCEEMMSVADIGRISGPVVWTLHDGWSFSGAEHYPDGPEDERYSQGYYRSNRPLGHNGVDLDAWVWRRKRRAWRRPFHIIAPSRWLADCAKRSVLMADWPVQVIPNPLPTEVFCPMPRALARKVFGLPQEAPVVLFGAMAGISRAKGWDLLEPALQKLAREVPGIIGVVAGQAEPANPPRLGLPLHFVGHLRDNAAMAMLYSAANAVALPSRLENLPQMGTEAQACGVPVVGFNCSGLPDVVVHGETGYLARPYEVDDLAKGLAWVLENAERWQLLSTKARQRALELWSPEVVVPRYLAAYHEAAVQQNGAASLVGRSRRP